MAKHLGTQKNIRFDDEELALLDALKATYGSYKAAIIAGLRALDGDEELTNDQLIKLLRVRLDR